MINFLTNIHFGGIVKTLGGKKQTELVCTEAFVKREEFDTRETRSLYHLEMVRNLTLRIPHLWLGKQNYLCSLGRKDGILSPRHSQSPTPTTLGCLQAYVCGSRVFGASSECDCMSCDVA